MHQRSYPCVTVLLEQHLQGVAMAEHPFAALLELIRFDAAIRQTQDQIVKLKDEVAAHRAQEADAIDVLDAAKRAAIDARKEVDAQELNVRELAESEQQKKEKLDAVEDHKIYRALRAELEMVQRKQQTAESALMNAINKHDAAQKALKEKTAAHTARVTELHESIATAEKKIGELQKEVDQAEGEREAKVERVPEEWRERYAAMRARVPDPVVPILEQDCSACFQPVTSQDFLRLQRGAITQCQGCFRLLYHEEAMAGSGEEQPAEASK